MDLLINLNIIAVCILMGFVFSGTLNIWYSLIKYDDFNLKVLNGVFYCTVSTVVAFVLCFVLINIA